MPRYLSRRKGNDLARPALILASLATTGFATTGFATTGFTGNGGVGGASLTPAPAASPSLSPGRAPTPTPAAATGPDHATSAAALYTTSPSVTHCVAGVLKPVTRARVLSLVNGIRALHALPPVGYSTADEPGTQQASLMMAANNALDHHPPLSWRCRTAAGAAAAGKSNLLGGWQSGAQTLRTDDAILAGWMDEIDNLVANNVGHRRWILNPFATTISYGRSVVTTGPSSLADYASLKVFGTTGGAPASTTPIPAFVAYPYGDYPSRYFNPRSLLSFGVVADTTSQAANAKVGYASATVRVTARGGGDLAVSNITWDTVGYGLPNNLQFHVTGLAVDTTYDVAIGDVAVNGASRSYAYAFRIVS